MPRCYRYSTYIQYDGTNSAAIVSAKNAPIYGLVWSVESESGGVLVLVSTDDGDGVRHETYETDDYCVDGDRYPFADFDDRFIKQSDMP